MFAAHKRTNNASGYAVFQIRVTHSFLWGMLYLYALHISEGESAVFTVSLVVLFSVDLAHSDHIRPEPDLLALVDVKCTFNIIDVGAYSKSSDGDFSQDQFWENLWNLVRLIFPILNHRLAVKN